MNIPQLHAVDFASLSPLFILLSGALLMLLVESFANKQYKQLCWPLAVVIIGAALFAALAAPQSENPLLTSWVRFDATARFFSVLFLAIGLGSVLLAASFFQMYQASQGEYYFFLISSLFGLVLISSSADFLTLFLGIETLSISMYILSGYMKKWKLSHESAIKFFLMGALATAFLVYGIALMYGGSGTTQFDLLLKAYQGSSQGSERALFLAGAALVTVGIGFKAAIVPFHMWAPDVYEGTSTPVTAFLAVGSKLGAFAAFVRVFVMGLPDFDLLWNQGMALIAYPTLIYANLLALRQTQLKRFFAYSGISHAGFMLIPLAAETPQAIHALYFYMVVYAAATLAAFAAVVHIDRGSDGISLHDLKGLWKRSPLAAGVLLLALMTLAGIPPTAGFFAKFYVFKTAYEAGYIGLVIVGLLTTAVAAYYYFRIAASMFAAEAPEIEPKAQLWPAVVIGSTASVLIAFLSFYPAPLLSLLSFW